jgi:hypothetical protein
LIFMAIFKVPGDGCMAAMYFGFRDGIAG